MVGLEKTRGQVGELQEALKAVQLELERKEFALEAKNGAGACVATRVDD